MSAASEDLDLTIGRLREAAALPPPDPDLAAALGWALADRHALTGHDDDRDDAITWLRRACETRAPGDGEPVDDLRLAALLAERGEDRWDHAEVQAGVTCAERTLTRLDGDLGGFAHYLLGVGHLLLAEISGTPAEFPAAVRHLRQAVALQPAADAEKLGTDARLGVALAAWVRADPAAADAPPAAAGVPPGEVGGAKPGEAGDPSGELVSEAIGLLVKARRDTPPDDPYLLQLRLWLATASAMRFLWYAGGEADCQLALSEFEAVLGHPGLDGGNADLCHVFAACLHLYRSAPENVRRRLGADPGAFAALLAAPPERPSRDSARAALDHLDQVSGTAGDMPAASAGFGSLLRAVANMALGEGDLADADVAPAAAALEEALRLTPASAPEAAELQGMLGLLHSVRVMRDGRAADARSVESLAAAARSLGRDHPLLPLMQSVLGGAGNLPPGSRAPSQEEGTAAIELLDSILDRMPEDHPASSEALVRLAGLLISRAMSLDDSVPRLRKLRRRLEDAASRPTAGPLSVATNLCLLGMTEGIEGLLAPDAELAKTAIERFKQAASIAPPEGPIRPYIRFGLICLLTYCYSQGHELQYLDAATHYAEEMVRATEADEISDPLLLTAEYLLICAPAARAPGRVSREQLAGLAARAQALLARIPQDHFMHASVAADVNVLRLLLAGLGDDGGLPAGPVRDAGQIARAADDAVALARATSPEDPFYAVNLGTAGNARAMQGTLTRDKKTLSEGIALLAEACAAATPVPDHHRRLVTMLGCAMRMRYDLTRDRGDLRNTISRLEEARRLAEEDRGCGDTAGILYLTALAYYERNDHNVRDRRRAVTLGLRALRERSLTVMLQSTTERAFDAAHAAAGEAADAARWCLANEDTGAAIEALEWGRGMVLHAATADASVPFLLRDGGHGALASEWEQALSAAAKTAPAPWDVLPGALLSAPRGLSGAGESAASAPELRLPSDLRYRVMRALEGGPRERLLAPPAVTEIVQALRGAGAQALVYLVPRDDLGSGLALVIHASGQASQINLPALAAGPHGPVGRFAEAQRDLYAAVPTSEEARLRWRQALGALCDWAWTAVMSEVLGALGGGPRRRARLVLVPVGDLGLVPWHAARRPVAGGGVRYACQDAAVSYAASARQFTEACRNGHRPWDKAPALVRVADSGLMFASKEIEEIHRRHYPHGILLGDVDRQAPPATAEGVLGLLPRPGADGASLLHLGCHTEPASRPVDGRLLLERGEPLSMRDILHQARARQRDSPGPLVVLAACGSDLARASHDEALNLATSFLAAGAAGVIGTRWPVDDLATLAFMSMFHHYLNSGYGHPPAALRAAQAWMLNPARSFAGGFRPKTAAMIRTLDLTAPELWAAFTYQGQ